MDVPVSAAEGQLTDLVRRAESGEEIVLTRFGQPVVRLVPVAVKITSAQRRAVLEQVRVAGAAKARRGASTARSQDFLYDESGLPK